MYLGFFDLLDFSAFPLLLSSHVLTFSYAAHRPSAVLCCPILGDLSQSALCLSRILSVCVLPLSVVCHSFFISRTCGAWPPNLLRDVLMSPRCPYQSIAPFLVALPFLM